MSLNSSTFRLREVVKQRKRRIIMNREFLKSLGLSEEQIDNIMAEHGKSIQNEKDKLSQVEKDLKKAQTTINKMKEDGGDADKVKALADTYKEKYEKSEAERKQTERKYEVKIALSKAGAKEKYFDTLTGLLKDVEVEDLEEKANELKNEYSELFTEPQKEKPKSTNAPGYKVFNDPKTEVPQGNKKGMTKEEIMAIPDQIERQMAIQDNLELFE